MLRKAYLQVAVLAIAASCLERPCGAVAQGDDLVALTISFANSKSAFHVGEVIPVALAFAASVDNTYEMSTRTYDRSGRLYLEQFHVSPSGRDPLDNYYHGGLNTVFMMGGLGSSKYLNKTPEVMQDDLNEWVAIDKPGHYSLYVTSSRVSKTGQDPSARLELRSNTLEFDVMEADPVWRQQMLDAAIVTLSKPDITREDRYSAMHVLRFMDSPASIREVIHRLSQPGGENRWDLVAALRGSVHQDVVANQLATELGDPFAAIPPEFVHILAETRFWLNHTPLSVYPVGDPEKESKWRSVQDSYTKEFADLENSLYERLATLLSAKQGTARAETMRTLLLRASVKENAQQPPSNLSDSDRAAAFVLLAPNEQVSLLDDYHWKLVASPALVASLETVLDQPVLKEYRLRSLALQRLYELDRTRGEARILAEIRQPHIEPNIYPGFVDANTLGVLPYQMLPQLDDVLVGRLANRHSQTEDLDAQLIGRYASRAVLARVKALQEAGADSCVAGDGLTVYFLRVDPDYGVSHMKKTAGHCMAKSWEMLAKMKRWPELQSTSRGPWQRSCVRMF